jgi:hypothetical protein
MWRLRKPIQFGDLAEVAESMEKNNTIFAKCFKVVVLLKCELCESASHLYAKTVFYGLRSNLEQKILNPRFYCVLNKCGNRALSSLRCRITFLQPFLAGKPCPSSTRCTVFHPSSSAFWQLSAESSGQVQQRRAACRRSTYQRNNSPHTRLSQLLSWLLQTSLDEACRVRFSENNHRKSFLQTNHLSRAVGPPVFHESRKHS